MLRESPIGGFNIYETGGEVVIEGVILQHGPPFGGGGVGVGGVEICADDGCGCAKYDTGGVNMRIFMHRGAGLSRNLTAEGVEWGADCSFGRAAGFQLKFYELYNFQFVSYLTLITALLKCNALPLRLTKYESTADSNRNERISCFFISANKHRLSFVTKHSPFTLSLINVTQRIN